MGLLKQYQTQEGGNFDHWYSQDFWIRERELDEKYWDDQKNRCIQLAHNLLSQKIIRDASRSSRRGPKPYLASYDEWKSLYLQRWANLVESNAKKSGITQADLTVMLGYSNSREWRLLKEGKFGKHGGARRMPDAKFMTFTKLNSDFVKSGIVYSRKWWRNGNLAHLWALQMPTEKEMLDWAGSLVTQN